MQSSFPWHVLVLRELQSGVRPVTAYYSENDPFAAAWLRELVAANLICRGDVDERSITEVAADDLKGYTQHHFFAGIGVWSYALRQAGWPDDLAVWTGSCPCQPFSAAGKRQGTSDERHLWPEWFRLIRESRPECIFGEQVSVAVSHGWLDLVCDGLESCGYTVGACDFPACGVGAPHIRQRLYFVAHASIERRQQISGSASGNEETHGRQSNGNHIAAGELSTGELAESNGGNASAERLQRSGEQRFQPQDRGAGVGLADTKNADRRPGIGGEEAAVRTTIRRRGSCGGSGNGDLGDATSGGRRECGDAPQQGSGGHAIGAGGAGFWSNIRWHYCRDGKYRPVPAEPALFPLAARSTGRVGLLRGAGNALCAPQAVAFIESYLEIKKAADIWRHLRP